MQQQQSLYAYKDSKQRICGIHKAVERVLLNDFQPRGQSLSAPMTECMQSPGTASKHAAQTTEVDPVTVTVEISPGILPCLGQQRHTSAPACPLPPPAANRKAPTESERDKTDQRHTAKPKCLQSQLPFYSWCFTVLFSP